MKDVKGMATVKKSFTLTVKLTFSFWLMNKMLKEAILKN